MFVCSFSRDKFAMGLDPCLGKLQRIRSGVSPTQGPHLTPHHTPTPSQHNALFSYSSHNGHRIITSQDIPQCMLH